ncbi:AraC family transcriptional regulator [Paenibacillus sp. GCM10023248]|uniref:AraC family transcriptional regulator n=1 Tax=unclassified Paenibacillus TaxID=185978 RepID=UPI0023789BD5|nr:AraC family transcriptional regulator [Paenibacillus sp. MAHUQ-63]MDD9265425.1 AraC family transcriptional regulator [Paenibacillus sp. MAHUQ-63]
MKRLFEYVNLERRTIFWDYLIRMQSNFKGYYHWHQCCEILFVHEGQGRVVLNRQTYDIRRGMLFFFQPFQLHQVYADVSPDTPYCRTIFYVDPLIMDTLLRPFANRHALFTSLWQGKGDCQVYDLSHQAEILEWLFGAYQQAYLAGKGEEDEELTFLFVHLMSCLLSVERKNVELPPADTHDRRAQRYSELMMQWIEDHFHEEINLDRLGEHMHLSSSYLSKVFQQETGSSLTDYVTARRIKQACRLLDTTILSVEQIGEAIGFPNSSYFIQVFKREVGMTPLKFRKLEV